MKQQAGETKRIWLLLLKEGGRWSAAEIAQKIEDFGDDMSGTLANLVSRGYLRRIAKDESNSRVQFVVTPVCKVPRDVTLRELMECGVFPAERARSNA